ncbi:malic enzyme [Chitinivibrio alkaliphilus ACht1]|uniref:Malic enzyme n=1 Tax=Chitinivibrio alkaliphilus ACht1 TaxID=1313304 RepID=U7D756_9BACT|nr:malic enzyme-like NAD(P)-binding protein [Chitinivibrio alkaliphilus]ERP31778.1 malic enzyme [Chitinivibrio alkaliphilus ACht1]
MSFKNDALAYHSEGRPGKIEVTLSKPCHTQQDLSYAYTPGVAEPCREIAKDPAAAAAYTAKSNLVAVITDGTAVLGLGNIGPLASKPVMEGKGVLFKRFADVDVFDLELATTDADAFIRTVEALEPTFGGINLEDIAAPDCFYIENELKKRLNIPVFHDDQHGTAVISGAALLNACEIQGKSVSDIQVVFSGAGSAAVSCARHYIRLGVTPENILMCDSKGLIYKGRADISGTYKEEFAQSTQARSLADALQGADLFAGLSTGGIVSGDMVRTMNERPIIFAMANPDPEITYEEACAAAPDCIMATGRSDYPNQVNNVLGFPFIFRGALDVGASAINEEMKVAATMALADLAKTGDVPEMVLNAYGCSSMKFGRDYIIPKPLDPRVLVEESYYVARAAVDSGVATRTIDDWDAYRRSLEDLAEGIQ